MRSSTFRDYARNSPQAAGRIVILSLVANGEVNAREWAALRGARAQERLGLTSEGWDRLVDEFCDDMAAATHSAGTCIVDAATLDAWLDEVDDPTLRTLVIELTTAIIDADGDVHPGEAVVLRSALARWTVSVEEQSRIESLLYGLDVEVVRRG